jgi:hypothetical protein
VQVRKRRFTCPFLMINTGGCQDTLGTDRMERRNRSKVFLSQPFRLVGVGKGGDDSIVASLGPMLALGANSSTALSVARQTYAERLARCNVGWCQDLIQVRHIVYHSTTCSFCPSLLSHDR